MSKKNTLEAKQERRKVKYLKNLTDAWNRTGYRVINGSQFPFQRPYRNFLKEYQEGKIKLIVKGGEYIMEDPNTNTQADPNVTQPTDQPSAPASEQPAGEQPASEPQVETPGVDGTPTGDGNGVSGETPASSEPTATEPATEAGTVTPEASVEGTTPEATPAEPQAPAEPAA